MMSVARSVSYVRKPPKNSYKMDFKEETTDEDDIFDIITDHLSTFRELNPNLQPLSQNEQNELSIKEITQFDPLGSSSESIPPPLPHRLPKNSSQSVPDGRKSNFSIRSKPKIASSKDKLTNQKFWKYHVLEMGDRFLYLTTNPDSQHLYCRNAPGIHVEILKFNTTQTKTQESMKSGFRLVFRDPLDEVVFMTLTLQNLKDHNELYLQSMRRFHKDEDGGIVRTDNDLLDLNLKADEKRIRWTKDRFVNSETNVNPIRYEFKDSSDHTWKVGSIPKFKSSTKLKNKRFVYFTSSDKKSLLGLFRPHELRMKKRLLNKLNRLSTSFEDTKYRYVNTEHKHVEALSDVNDVYYTPSDGIDEKTPIDDSPNDIKLGWITVLDESDFFKTPGNWEMVIGFNLAVGLIKLFNEK